MVAIIVVGTPTSIEDKAVPHVGKAKQMATPFEKMKAVKPLSK